MIGLAKRTKPGIFQVCISKVYGGPQVHPQPENNVGHVNQIGPCFSYDDCFSTIGASTIWISRWREFSTPKGRMHPNDGQVVSNFIVQALRNEPNTLYGDGTQSRSFCYVNDLIEDFFVRLINKPADFTGPVNLGNLGEFTMIELAEKIRDLTGSRSEFIHKPLPADDPRHRWPDVSLPAANSVGRPEWPWKRVLNRPSPISTI